MSARVMLILVLFYRALLWIQVNCITHGIWRKTRSVRLFIVTNRTRIDRVHCSVSKKLPAL